MKHPMPCWRLTPLLWHRCKRIGGAAFYRALKARGVLVRHFDKPRIRDYSRITIGTMAQMQTLIAAIRDILKEAAQ